MAAQYYGGQGTAGGMMRRRQKIKTSNMGCTHRLDFECDEVDEHLEVLQLHKSPGSCAAYMGEPDNQLPEHLDIVQAFDRR